MTLWTRRRLLYALTALAMVAVTTGFSVGTVLTTTSVGESASLYSVSTGGVAAFPNTPSVAVSAMPPTVSACSATPAALGSGGAVALYLPAAASVSCTANDFAVIFNFTSSASAAAGSYTFTAYTSFGPGPTSGASTGVVTLSGPLSSAGTVSVYVDFGTNTPPAGGIGSLSLVVG